MESVSYISLANQQITSVTIQDTPLVALTSLDLSSNRLTTVTARGAH